METLGWLIAYVVGFGLVQVLLYRYVQRDDTAPETTPGGDQSSGRSMEQSSTRPAEGSRAPSGEALRCHHCGALNEYDQMFSYCKQCIEQLQ